MSISNNSIKVPREGQLPFRFLMVLGSMAPLFLFLAIRGVPTIADKPIISNTVYVIACITLIVIPTVILAFRINLAEKKQDKKELTIGSFTDNREHLLTYLFAVIVPLYQNNYNSLRDVAAEVAVLGFILFLFVHMNMHYMNILFAIFGYRVYTVEADAGQNIYSSNSPFILLTKRHQLSSGQKITARRISDTVFIE